MIISVHMPKTAGTSFYKTLESAYGNRIILDYNDTPLNHSAFTRNTTATIKNLKKRFVNLPDCNCIHGHFLPYKYAPFYKQSLFITWLRNPVERLASHYYFWLRNFSENQAFTLQKKIVDENWSFEKFAFSKEMKNTYRKFLWNFPIEKFHFIGITEHYNLDLKYLTEHILKIEAPEFKENINSGNAGNYNIPDELRKDIELFHAEDMAIYNYALSNRMKRTRR